MSKHTPGPWKVIVEEKFPNISQVMMPFGAEPAYVAARSNEEEMANAHLIAAAPEMLEALNEISDFLANGVGAHECAGWDCARCGKSYFLDLANAAIAKAGGAQ